MAYHFAQRFVTVSARRATVWDGKTGEALTTLTSERLLGNDQADMTAFSLDHQVRRAFDKQCSLANRGERTLRLSCSGSTYLISLSGHKSTHQLHSIPRPRRGFGLEIGAQAGRRCGYRRHPCVPLSQRISHQATRPSQWAGQLAFVCLEEDRQVRACARGREGGREVYIYDNVAWSGKSGVSWGSWTIPVP